MGYYLKIINCDYNQQVTKNRYYSSIPGAAAKQRPRVITPPALRAGGVINRHSFFMRYNSYLVDTSETTRKIYINEFNNNSPLRGHNNNNNNNCQKNIKSLCRVI